MVDELIYNSFLIDIDSFEGYKVILYDNDFYLYKKQIKANYSSTIHIEKVLGLILYFRIRALSSTSRVGISVYKRIDPYNLNKVNQIYTEFDVQDIAWVKLEVDTLTTEVYNSLHEVIELEVKVRR